MTSKIISFASPGTAESASPAADRLVSGEPRQSIWNAFSTPDGCFHLGQWHSSRGAWRVRYTEYEFCHLLAGKVRLSDDDGLAHEFGPGDSFLIVKGFCGVWEVLEDCTKLYAIYEPKA
jgi:uncharacterized protein